MLDFFLYAGFLKHYLPDTYDELFPVEYVQAEWVGDEADETEAEASQEEASAAGHGFNPTVWVATNAYGRDITLGFLASITIISILHSILYRGLSSHLFFAALFPLTNLITIIISIITFGLLFGIKKKKK